MADIIYTWTEWNKAMTEAFFKQQYPDSTALNNAINEYTQTGTFSKTDETAFDTFRKNYWTANASTSTNASAGASTWTTTTTANAWTTDTAGKIVSPTTVTAEWWLANVINNAEEVNKNITQEAVNNANQQITDIADQSKTDIANAEKTAAQKAANLAADKIEQEALDAENQKAIDDAKKQAIEYAEKTKDNEIKAAQDEAELQKMKDEAAIKEAQEKMEVASQQANFAFNKMWLTFSSWAVLQSQSITNKWAAAIASLKIQANYNQAAIKTKIAQISLDYTKIINDAINTAVDKSNTLKTDTAKRMSDYRNNLTLNEEQKNEKISSLTKEYRTEKYKLQNDINATLQAASDKAVESAAKLQAALKDEQSSAKMKIETMMNSWTWNTLTQAQKENYAKQAWMTLIEVNKTSNWYITKNAYSIISKAIEWYIPTTQETEAIINDTNRLMTMWKSMDEAINIATNRVINNNATYKLQQKYNKYKLTEAMKPKVKSSKEVKLEKVPYLDKASWIVYQGNRNPYTWATTLSVDSAGKPVIDPNYVLTEKWLVKIGTDKIETNDPYTY